MAKIALGPSYMGGLNVEKHSQGGFSDSRGHYRVGFAREVLVIAELAPLLAMGLCCEKLLTMAKFHPKKLFLTSTWILFLS
jgi:hypothetical protein